jgi:hypothetical protein
MRKGLDQEMVSYVDGKDEDEERGNYLVEGPRIEAHMRAGSEFL